MRQKGEIMLIRPVKIEDVDNIVELAKHIGQGLTSLKPDTKVILPLVQKSIKSFDTQDRYGMYLFVLEDDGKVVGTAGIFNGLGKSEPFYCYSVVNARQINDKFGVDVGVDYLNMLIWDERSEAPSEICSLFLHPVYRKGNTGKLITKCRYLFMAEFPHLFDKYVIAQLRAYNDENGINPFFEEWGKHFTDMTYEEVDDYLTLGTDVTEELIPRDKIYLHMLSEEARGCLGMVHPETEPAKRLVEKEGFYYWDKVCIYAGGPMYVCERESIKSVKESEVKIISKLNDQDLDEMGYAIISTQDMEFKACIARYSQDQGLFSIDVESANLLGIVEGDAIRVLFL
jgi:arginine N-succinyltransferase